MKNKIVIVMIGAVIVAVIGVFFWMKNSVSSDEILKTAVKKSELSGKECILCQEAWVTGFDWVAIQNENGESVREYCNIIGENPFSELPLSYEFSMADNIFVFYVKERRTYYSEEIKEDMVEYVVTGWDILYPVKHGDLSGFLKTSKHIIKSDINTQND